VHVVHKRVGDVGGGKGRRKLRLPDAFGKPSAEGTPAKMFFEIGGKTGDLFQLIFGGDGNKDWFVKAAAN
jgi:hypothetical protein